MNYDKDSEFKQPSALMAYLQLGAVIGFVVISFYLAGTMAGTNFEQSEQPQEEALTVETITLKPTTQHLEFARTGTVDLTAMVNLTPQVSGKVVSINPKLLDGGAFEAGETLFTIEQDNFENSLTMAKAEVEQAETALMIEKAEAKTAKEEWQTLYENRPIPDLVARIPQLQQARAAVKAAEARLKDAQLNLDRTTVSYPFNGRVIENNIEIGQIVQPGQSYGQVYNNDALQIIVPLEEDVIKWVTPEETTATIKTQHKGEDITLTGTISRIGARLDPNTRFTNAFISLSEEDKQKLTPELFVNVLIKGPELNNLWIVPNSAIQGRTGLWEVNFDDTLSYRQTLILARNDSHTVIQGNGKTINVVKGLLKGAADGMPVKLSNNTAE